MIPSDMATGDAATIEEERRLLYVAMTRARDTLEIHLPLRYHRRPRGLGDSHGYAQLTRFIPDALRHLFDERSVGENATGTVAAGSDQLADSAPVDRLLEALFAG